MSIEVHAINFHSQDCSSSSCLTAFKNIALMYELSVGIKNKESREQMAFAIVINEKGGQPRRQEFLKGEITIGRVQGNDIVLPKQNVSKRHSRVVLKNGKFVITDLKSTNGTYVNGRKITTPMVIKETDKIYIGDFVLSAELSDGSAEGASSPGLAPPPPPPANSLAGSRPAFPGNMPSKTIASGVSPFQDPPGAPANAAPPVPSLGAHTPPPPPNQPAPPASVSQSPFGSANDAVAPSQAQSNGLPTGNLSMGGASPSPFAAQREETPEPVPVQQASAPSIQKTPPTPSPSPASPFGSTPEVNTPEPVRPAASMSGVQQVASQSAPSISPASVEVDASVFDGESDNAQLVKIHQALNDGLAQRQLTAPTRYRPGQSLNPSLIDAAHDILKGFTQEHSEDGIALIMNEAFGVGALQPLIEDESVKEIYLNGAHQLVYMQQSYPTAHVSSPFTSTEQATRAAMRILNGLGREGQTCAEGRLGPFRTFVDLEGAEGPYVCLQRVRQPHQLSGLVGVGQIDQQLAQSISDVIGRGGKLVIAGASTASQSLFTSAIAQELFQSKRTVLVGVHQHLGSNPSWLTTEGSDEALDGVARLNPEAIIISDQPALSGNKMLETLSSASAGILTLTARDVNSAFAKLRRRAGDDTLAVEATDAVIFVQSQGDEVQVTDVYHVGQGQLVFSQGAWSGHLA